MISHTQARAIVEEAVERVLGRPGNDRELQAVQAVSHHESSYGSGWSGAGVGSNNWGAMQGTGNAGFFTYTDSHPDGTTYVTKFGRWQTPVDGAAAVAKWLLSHAKTRYAIENGTIHDVAEAMHTDGYYEEHGATVEDRVQHYSDALGNSLLSILTELKQPLAIQGESTSRASAWGWFGLLTAGAIAGATGWYFLRHRR